MCIRDRYCGEDCSVSYLRVFYIQRQDVFSVSYFFLPNRFIWGGGGGGGGGCHVQLKRLIENFHIFLSRAQMK